jgi:hypothetical protein
MARTRNFASGCSAWRSRAARVTSGSGPSSDSVSRTAASSTTSSAASGSAIVFRSAATASSAGAVTWPAGPADPRAGTVPTQPHAGGNTSATIGRKVIERRRRRWRRGKCAAVMPKRIRLACGNG